MADTTRYELWQGGIMVVEVEGDDPDAVRREILHYVAVYAQDGPVEIRGDDAKELFDAMTKPRAA